MVPFHVGSRVGNQVMCSLRIAGDMQVSRVFLKGGGGWYSPPPEDFVPPPLDVIHNVVQTFACKHVCPPR